MQSVCLKDARAAGPLAEETSLVGLTFGGYLHSKVVHNFDTSLMSMYSLNFSYSMDCNCEFCFVIV